MSLARFVCGDKKHLVTLFMVLHFYFSISMAEMLYSFNHCSFIVLINVYVGASGQHCLLDRQCKKRQKKLGIEDKKMRAFQRSRQSKQSNHRFVLLLYLHVMETRD